jgi:hypothetical protein
MNLIGFICFEILLLIAKGMGKDGGGQWVAIHALGSVHGGL